MWFLTDFNIPGAANLLGDPRVCLCLAGRTYSLLGDPSVSLSLSVSSGALKGDEVCIYQKQFVARRRVSIIYKDTAEDLVLSLEGEEKGEARGVLEE